MSKWFSKGWEKPERRSNAFSISFSSSAFLKSMGEVRVFGGAVWALVRIFWVHSEDEFSSCSF